MTRARAEVFDYDEFFPIVLLSVASVSLISSREIVSLFECFDFFVLSPHFLCFLVCLIKIETGN